MSPAAMQGFICALVTPVDGDGNVNLGELERVVAGGLAGFQALAGRLEALGVLERGRGS